MRPSMNPQPDVTGRRRDVESAGAYDKSQSRARLIRGVITAVIVIGLLLAGALLAIIGTAFTLVLYIALAGVWGLRSKRWTAAIFGLVWGVWGALFQPAAGPWLSWDIVALLSAVVIAGAVAAARR
jgi:hypothetical protein